MENKMHHHKLRDIVIVGGFLGAGKTTFLNHMLSENTAEKIDVLVREYGKVSIDDKLINISPEHIHVFANVSVHQDPQLVLYDYLHNLFRETHDNPFDTLLLESSGLDSPEGLVQMFMLGHMPMHYNLSGYVVIIDGEYGNENFDEYPVAVEQAAYADVIIINKTDIADAQKVQKLKERIQKINSLADIYTCEFGKVDVSASLNKGIYGQLKSCIAKGAEKSMDNMQTVVLTSDKPMDKEKINKWLNGLFNENSAKILRGKGFFCFENDSYRYEFQSVRRSFHSKADKMWTDGEEKKSTVVLIGSGLEDMNLEESFEKCVSR